MQSWMIYGATGYTGELIAREAVSRGLKPILAGREASRISALAHELGCQWRTFDLSHPDLSGVSLVLNCAGPFLHTAAPMLEACLAAKAHYLDITGEIAVFESIFRRHHDALESNVTLLPGVGFDVVPTDCLASMLRARMPDADELWLAFSSKSGVSRGTLKTMIEGAGWGGAIRRGGKIVRVRQMWDVREIPFASGPRMAMTIPWGDVSTAYRTTGIPNIRVYSSQSKRSLTMTRRLRPLLPLLRLGILRKLAHRFADRTTGPSAEVRSTARVELWGRVTNPRRDVKTMTMSVVEGYAFTALSAVEAVQGVLAAPRAGAFTPAGYFGPDFVKKIPGTVI